MALSAAFDVIDHNLVLKKCRCCGFASSALLWIESDLSNRTQRVFVNGSMHLSCKFSHVWCTAELQSVLEWLTSNRLC